MRPVLKYCGNHSFHDLQTSLASRADYIGFIFTPKSKRTVTADQVAKWLNHSAPIGNKQLVGVFADDSMKMIEQICRAVKLHVIQCHGHETARDLKEIKSVTGRPVWKALHHEASTLEVMKNFEGAADGFIIDTKVNGALGGTGIVFDWASVPDYLKEASRQKVPCLIAGGVNKENIGKLLTYHPTGIDIASGIESEGRKNSELMRKIEEKVWLYDQAAD